MATIITPQFSQRNNHTKITLDVAEMMKPLAKQIKNVLVNTLDHKTSARKLAALLSENRQMAKGIRNSVNADSANGQTKVTTLRQAVVRAGFTRIKNLAVEHYFYYTVINRLQSPHCDGKQFWRHCTVVAVLARAIAEEIGYPNPEEAYHAGLFHDIGKLFLLMQDSFNHAELLALANKPDISLVDHEASILGTRHDRLGADFLKTCGFSDTLMISVRDHHSRESGPEGAENMPLTAVVQMADFIAWTLGMGSFTGIYSPALSPATEKQINLEQHSLSRLVAAIEPPLRQAAAYYQFTLPDTIVIHEHLFQSNMQLSTLKSQYHRMAKEKQRSDRLANHSNLLLLPHQSLNSSAIIENTMQAIRDDMFYDESWVFRFNQEKRLMVSKPFPGAMMFNAGGMDHQFALAPEDEAVLESIRHRKPMVMDGKSRIERQLLQMIQASQATIVPIAGLKRIHGMVCLVKNSTNMLNKPESFHELAQIFHQIGIALDNARLLTWANNRAIKDKLTGIINRTGLDDRYAQAFQQAKVGKTLLSVAMVDIDYFKKFNDRFGHQEGDRVLKLVAQVLSNSTRASGIVGRYGGEEFMIILKETSLDEAWAYCERIRKDVEKLGVVLSKRYKGHALTVSMGVATFQADIRKPSQLVQNADRALYRAKSAGRNCVTKYCPNLQNNWLAFDEPMVAAV